MAAAEKLKIQQLSDDLRREEQCTRLAPRRPGRAAQNTRTCSARWPWHEAQFIFDLRRELQCRSDLRGPSARR